MKKHNTITSTILAMVLITMGLAAAEVPGNGTAKPIRLVTIDQLADTTVANLQQHLVQTPETGARSNIYLEAGDCTTQSITHTLSSSVMSNLYYFLIVLDPDSPGAEYITSLDADISNSGNTIYWDFTFCTDDDTPAGSYDLTFLFGYLNIYEQILDARAEDYTMVIEDPSSILVQSPNGGESWQIGSTQIIQWDDDVSGMVNIKLYKGGYYNQTITNSTLSDGQYTWSIPADLEPGDDYKIKVQSNSNTGVYDYSNSYFSIESSTPPSAPINLVAQGNAEVISLSWDNGGADRSDVELWISNANNEFIELSISNNQPVFGFQLDIVSDPAINVTLGNTYGGLSEDAGWMVSTNSTGTVLGFSIMGTSIPVGNGVLCQVEWEHSETNGWLDLSITNVAGMGGVLLSTTAGSPYCYGECDEQSNLTYNIYRDGELLSSGDSANEYVDPDVEPAVEYCYTVTAVVGGLESGESNQSCASLQVIVCGLGDVNQDDQVDILDVVDAARIYNAELVPSSEQLCAADYDEDGEISLVEIIQLVAQILEVDPASLGRCVSQLEAVVDQNVVTLKADGAVAGVEFTVNPGVACSDCNLPSGWMMVKNAQRIALFSIDGTSLSADYTIQFDSPDPVTTVKVVDWNGNEIEANVTEDAVEIQPSGFQLAAPYPNPFNPATSLSFTIPAANHVQLIVYDLTGRQVATLVNEYQEAGTHELTWNAAGLPTGIYIARLQTCNFTSIQRMTLVK